MTHDLHSIVAGIDVSKFHLDAAVCGLTQTLHIGYGTEGLAQLLNWLGKHRVNLVVLEATGGYEYDLINCLNEAGISFHLANPRQVRDFARATDQLAKTDKIDAQVIANYGQILRVLATPMPSKIRLKLREYITCYRQLT